VYLVGGIQGLSPELESMAPGQTLTSKPESQWYLVDGLLGENSAGRD